MMHGQTKIKFTIRLAAASTCRRERTLTKSTQQRPCSQADSSPASTETAAYYTTRSFITLLGGSRHLSLSWATSIQAMPSQSFFNIHFIYLFTPRSSKWLFSLRPVHQNPICISLLRRTYQLPSPFVYKHTHFWHQLQSFQKLTQSKTTLSQQ